MAENRRISLNMAGRELKLFDLAEKVGSLCDRIATPLPRTKLPHWVNAHERDQHCAYFGSRADCLMLVLVNLNGGFLRKRPLSALLLYFPSYNQFSWLFALLLPPGMVW